jgi:hypothetical protein
MKVEYYGLNKKSKFKKWYAEFTGIKVFGRKFLGFSIYSNKVVIQLKPEIISKPSVGIWLILFFYEIHVEFKDPWKGTNHESQ